MTTVRTTQLSKMDNDSKPGPDWYRMLYRFLEQLQRQTGTTIAQVDDANIPQIAANTADTVTAQTQADLGVTNAATSQTSADNAAIIVKANPSFFQDWTTIDDGTGTFTAGNPTRDLGIDVVDKADSDSKATRVLRGTLTSAAGTVAVTNVSSTADTGYSTAFALVDDGTANVRADITITFPDASKQTVSVSWIARDISNATSIPATGGGK